jgi:hypothetical protein
MNTPAPTVRTASAMLPNVRTGSYRTGLPGTSKPSIAMKCMSQMPAPPIAIAASTSQRVRRPGVWARRARAVHSRPSVEPRKAMRYAATGVNKPYVK